MPSKKKTCKNPCGRCADAPEPQEEEQGVEEEVDEQDAETKEEEGEGEEKGVSSFEVVVEEESEKNPPLRLAPLFSAVDDDAARELIFSLLVLANDGPEPIEMHINSRGGSTINMFAIYDVMRKVRETNDINVTALGSCMSAAVLLLASGTKGKRGVGRHTRLMLHPAQTGFEGSSNRAHQHVEEIRNTERLYVEALVRETDGKLSKRFLEKIIKNDGCYFLCAEEAIERGLADFII